MRPTAEDSATNMKRTSRPGIPQTIVDNIKKLYQNPTFKVMQGLHESEWQKQRTGIRQGCPLKPYLFILIIHVMFLGCERTVQRPSTAKNLSKYELPGIAVCRLP